MYNCYVCVHKNGFAISTADYIDKLYLIRHECLSYVCVEKLVTSVFVHLAVTASSELQGGGAWFDSYECSKKALNLFCVYMQFEVIGLKAPCAIYASYKIELTLVTPKR